MSQKERNLILKVSGFSEKAWGARGVYLGSDLSHDGWSAAVEEAIALVSNDRHTCCNDSTNRAWSKRNISTSRKTKSLPMPGRVRLCPYYFVNGDGDAARAQLGGVLATICPADKKIIHGMSTPYLAPCSI